MACHSDDETTSSGHHRDCEWHAEQYPWECTCGLIKRQSRMTNPVLNRDF